METAIVVLCTGEYWKGAKVLFHTLKKYGNLPSSVDRITLGIEVPCDFAEAMPIDRDYSWVSVNQQHFPKVADKFAAFSLPNERIILMDADMLCVGDCSLLWSKWLDPLPFYAVRDVASVFYYGKVIKEIELDHSLLFNGGLYVIRRADFPRNEFLCAVAEGTLSAYDGGDQGYLNHWMQKTGTPFGFLPLEYNACTDFHFPLMQEGTARVIHFTGSNVNPWNPQVGKDDRRWPLLSRWKAEWEECNQR